MSHHGSFCRTIVLDVVRVFRIMDGGRRSDPMLCRQRGAAETRQLPEISRRERRRCECITPSGLFHGSLYSCYQRSLKSNHLRSGDGYIFKTHRRSAGSPSVTSGSAANPPILFAQDGSSSSIVMPHRFRKCTVEIRGLSVIDSLYTNATRASAKQKRP